MAPARNVPLLCALSFFTGLQFHGPFSIAYMISVLPIGSATADVIMCCLPPFFITALFNVNKRKRKNRINMYVNKTGWSYCDDQSVGATLQRSSIRCSCRFIKKIQHVRVHLFIYCIICHNTL